MTIVLSRLSVTLFNVSSWLMYHWRWKIQTHYKLFHAFASAAIIWLKLSKLSKAEGRWWNGKGIKSSESSQKLRKAGQYYWAKAFNAWVGFAFSNVFCRCGLTRKKIQNDIAQFAIFRTPTVSWTGWPLSFYEISGTCVQGPGFCR